VAKRKKGRSVTIRGLDGETVSIDPSATQCPECSGWSDGYPVPCSCYAGPNRSIFLDPAQQEINDFLEHENMINLPTAVKKGSKATAGGTSIPPQGQFYGSHGGNAGYVTTAAYKSCEHKGHKIVFEEEGKKLYASSWQGLNEYSGRWNLIIDLAGNVKPPAPPTEWDKFIRTISTVQWVDELDPYVYTVPPKELKSELLSLKWTDMGIPPVGLDFWLVLWGKLPEKTVIVCQGGHGRTGTCLAAFMIATGLDYWTAFETVRSEHCQKAIESMEQEKYLHALYLERLEMDLHIATTQGKVNDVKELEEDIVYAKANPPSFSSSKGSKVHQATAAATVTTPSSLAAAVDNDEFYGEIQNTEVRDGKTWHLRCTDQGCATFKCKLVAHLRWVKAHELSTTLLVD